MPTKTTISWTREGDCIVCTSHAAHPYPRVFVKSIGKQISIHSLVCARRNRLQVSALHSLHSCDNPRCIRPDHLRPGSDKDNKSDSVKRGRSVRGERSPFAKFGEKEALEIRGSELSNRTLAEIYGVSHSTVERIKKRKRWRFS